MTEEERAAEEYRATLDELNTISKVEINALTMLAEENKQFAPKIATCIEQQLKSVPNHKKLPVLYLIDSICKNYPKSTYVQLFTQNLVSNFCNVFEVSDEKVRRSLHKLRMTWDATKLFPQKKLEAIDERVHEMDPNWPVLHKISQQRQQQQQQHQQQQQPQQQLLLQTPQAQLANPVRAQNQPGIQSKLAAKTNAPSVSNSKRSNGGQQNGPNGRKRLRSANRGNQNSEQVLLPPPQHFLDPMIMQQAPELGPMTYLDPGVTALATADPVHSLGPTPFLDPNLIHLGPNDPKLSAPHLLCPTPYNQTPQIHQPPPNRMVYGEPQAPHIAILDSLYGGKQCSNCSLRFDDNNRYSVHLDWHFRQNQKSDSLPARRKWYYPLNLWVQFREINDDDLQDNAKTDSAAVTDPMVPVCDHEIPTALASKNDDENICSVCHETFEKFYEEEEEEWRLRNAKLHDDNKVYHPLCLMDMLQASLASSNS